MQYMLLILYKLRFTLFYFLVFCFYFSSLFYRRTTAVLFFRAEVIWRLFRFNTFYYPNSNVLVGGQSWISRISRPMMKSVLSMIIPGLFTSIWLRHLIMFFSFILRQEGNQVITSDQQASICRNRFARVTHPCTTFLQCKLTGNT